MNRLLNAPMASALLAALMLALPTGLGAEAHLQILSVQDEAAARRSADRLFDQGVPAFVKTEEVSGRGLWHRVYVGPFETEAEAKAAGEGLKAQGSIREFLVKSEPWTVPSSPAAPATENGVPVIGGAADPVPLTEFPAQNLPVAQVPTYGEPISPDQARELGLSDPAAPLPVPGQTGAVPPPPAPLPHGLSDGDDLPGLAPGAATPAAPSGGRLPTYGEAAAPVPPAAPQSIPAPPAAIPAPPTAIPAPAAAPVMAAPIAAPTVTAAPNASVAKTATPAPRPDGPTPAAEMTIDGFTMLVDLSSSMRNMSNCQGRIKEEAVAALLRKINHRVPGQPYTAALRVLGYKAAWTRKDFTTTYFGPTTYDRDLFEDAIARLTAADSVSPFGEALKAASDELAVMGPRKAVLMFADFEETMGSGAPVRNAAEARRRYGKDLEVHTFYITRSSQAAALAREIAAAGGGKAWEICRLISDEAAFEAMMMEIFGPADLPPCPDRDGDGVCDEDDLCPDTPRGAPVDSRGCWIAAYAQFFDFDKAVVKSAFLPRIQHAADILKGNPALPKVTIAGHTDNIGTDDYNLDLGRRRAQAVFDLMVKYGVEPGRMTVQSYGKTRPIAPNDTEENRARNRRVEFHIGDVPPEK